MTNTNQTIPAFGDRAHPEASEPQEIDFPQLRMLLTAWHGKYGSLLLMELVAEFIAEIEPVNGSQWVMMFLPEDYDPDVLTAVAHATAQKVTQSKGC
ncbi:MAG: hypothetical protein HC910_21590 [Spirulinaceae cyanobacterium SM2_1_0]|nr:hypothetical protein [Spirulinaceae cyanobacterium SM2_1_0]